MSESKVVKDWRDGLERVGYCPHCGASVYVRVPGDGEVAELGPDGLPKPLYLCSCRTLSIWNQKSLPAFPPPPPNWGWPVLPTISPPPLPDSPAPFQPWKPYPPMCDGTKMIHIPPPQDYTVTNEQECKINGATQTFTG